MAKKPKTALTVPEKGFDYSRLEAQIAEKVRSSADKIRHKIRKTLEDVMEVGRNLIAVKESLPHGQFGRWLAMEFGWTERMARNFMAVAERFGPKTEIISDLRIAPTAAYLLAAPSAPDEACQSAIQRAEAGEQITTTVAKEILVSARKKARSESKRARARDLGVRLLQDLERYWARWNPRELMKLAEKLREFADELEKQHRTAKK